MYASHGPLGVMDYQSFLYTLITLWTLNFSKIGSFVIFQLFKNQKLSPSSPKE